MNSHDEVVDNSTNDPESINDCDRTLLCDSTETGRPERTSALLATRALYTTWLGVLKGFVVSKTNLWFFVGSVMLVLGAALYINAVGGNDSGMFDLSLVFIFGGGIFIWVPIFYWMSEPAGSTDPSSDQEAPHPSPRVHIPRDKPPDYESLTPLGNPPPYEEVNLLGDYLHAPPLSLNSTAVNIEVPAVHQVTVALRGNDQDTRVEQTRSNGRGIRPMRRRSTGDLYSTVRERNHL